jgi:mannose-1-phosphate guanylyltransferase
MINLVLCGGSGTRLWPLSRTMLPKQFVRLFNNRSLFQETVLRNQACCSNSFIILNNEQFFLAVDQLSSVTNTSCRFLLEPIGRNTAPAIALACLALDEDDLVLVTASDHLIKNQSAYQAAVAQAKHLAEEGYLVTFGIQPHYPETGFGYIEASGCDVLSFKEKPSLELAQSYLAQGNYYWNSGMFCFKAGVLLTELQQHAPTIYEACQSAFHLAETKKNETDNIHIALATMQAIPDQSIDYAVMEKSNKVKVVPCEIGWSDLGSFDALYEAIKQPETDNALLPCEDNTPEPIYINAQNNLLLTHDRQVALIDVDDLLVVDTADALLIAKKGSSQQVKQVVEQIKLHSPDLTQVHYRVHRPWGTYEVLLSSSLYKIKRIAVKPAAKLSLQQHYHRNEHWIVVSGMATVTIENETFFVRPNESTYIKMGQTHRLENQGKIELVMIEVQVGEYVKEDDIVRFDDLYGR